MNIFDLTARIRLDGADFEKGIKDAQNTVERMGGMVGGAFKNIAKIGAAAMTASGAAVVGFATKSVMAGKDFDSAMSQVAATMGKTVDQIKDDIVTTDSFSGSLRDLAKQLGSETAFSATQCAEALNYMALAGYDAQTSADMLPKVLDLAAAGNMDLARASDMVTDAQSALGLSVEETEQMINRMATASTKTNTSVEQLGDAFLNVGATARVLKGGTTELSQALGLMANFGTKGSEAGIHLRNILLSLNPQTDKAAEAWQALGVSAYTSDGEMRPLVDTFTELQAAMQGMSDQERQATLSAMFNKTDLKAVNALLETQREDWDNLAIAIENSDGMAAGMAKTQMDNLQGGIVAFKSALEGVQIAISDMLTPAVTEFVSNATSGLQDIAKSLNAGDIDGAISAISGVFENILQQMTAAIPQVVEVSITLLKSLGDGLIQNAPVLIDTALEVLRSLLSGIQDIIPELTAKGGELIPALSEGIGTAISLLIEDGANIIFALADGIAQNIPSLLSMGADILTRIMDGLYENIGTVAEGAMAIINSLTETITQNGAGFIQNGIVLIKDFAEKLRENVGLIVDSGLQLVMSLADSIIESLPVLIENIPQIVISIAGIINDNAPKLLQTGIELIGKLAIGIIQAIPTLVANIPQIIMAIVSVWQAFNWIQLGTNLITAIKDGVTSIASHIPEAMNNIGNKAVELFRSIDWRGLGGNVIKFIVNGIKALVTAVPNALKSIATTAINAVKTMDWLGLGKAIIQGLINGVGAMAGAAVKAIKNLASDMLKGVKNLFGINSPSKVFKQIGEYCIEGLEQPFDNYDAFGMLDGVIPDIGAISPTYSLAGAGGGTFNLDYDLLGEKMANAIKGLSVNMDGRAVGELIAPDINNALGSINRRRT